MLLGPEALAKQELAVLLIFELLCGKGLRVMPASQGCWGAHEWGRLQGGRERARGAKAVVLHVPFLPVLPPCPGQLGNGPSWRPGCFPWPGSHSGPMCTLDGGHGWNTVLW